MRCYKCGSRLTEANTCPNCGAAVYYFKKILTQSAAWYNDGLRRARVRDLSGAGVSLRRSLKYNKRNVPARNLLGLVAYEQGHLAEALSEWIVSANIMPRDNPASRYLQDIQKDAAGTDKLKTDVTHYNEALAYLASRHEDLGFLQLKKLVSGNTRLPEAYLLMALLCMQRGSQKTAVQCLKRVAKMDRGCTLAPTYFAEMVQRKKRAGAQGEGEGGKEADAAVYYRSFRGSESRPSLAVRETSFFSALTQTLIGLAFGAAIVGFLVLPARLSAVRREASEAATAYAETLSEKDAQISALEEAAAAAETASEGAETKENEANAKAEAYERLLAYREQYREGAYDTQEITAYLNGLDRDSLGEQGQALYDYLWNAMDAENAENQE